MFHINHPVWSVVLFMIKNIHSSCWKIAAQGRSLRFYHQDCNRGFDGGKNFVFILINTYTRHSLLLTLKLIMTWLTFVLNPLFIRWRGSGRMRWRNAEVRRILECFMQDPKLYHTQNWWIHDSEPCAISGSPFRLRYFLCATDYKSDVTRVWKIIIEVGERMKT